MNIDDQRALIEKATKLAAEMVRRAGRKPGKDWGLEVARAFAMALIAICESGAVSKDDRRALAQDILSNAQEFVDLARKPRS